MLHVKIPSVVLFGLLAIGNPPMNAQGIPQALQDQLAELHSRLAPDRRVAYFDVQCTAVDGKNVVLHGAVQDSATKAGVVHALESDGWHVNASGLATLPDSSVAAGTHGVASTSALNIRFKPDQAAELGTQAILGTPLRVLKKERGWFLVKTPDQYLGWTEGRIAVMTDSAFAAWTQREKVIVTSTYAFSYASPEAPDSLVSDLVAGAILGVVGNEGAFYAVEYPDGRRGFVRKTDAEPFASWLRRGDPTADDIIRTARRFMGIPYMWGGTSTKAMDCSGFAKTVYFLNGILLPRDASQQVHVGVPVEGGDSLDQFMPGDLLFFGSAAKGEKKERVTHVAISLGGRRFINASGDVCLGSLDPSDRDYSKHRRHMFLRARRILGAGTADGIQRIADLNDYAQPIER